MYYKVGEYIFFYYETYLHVRCLLIQFNFQFKNMQHIFQFQFKNMQHIIQFQLKNMQHIFKFQFKNMQ